MKILTSFISLLSCDVYLFVFNSYKRLSVLLHPLISIFSVLHNKLLCNILLFLININSIYDSTAIQLHRTVLGPFSHRYKITQ